MKFSTRTTYGLRAIINLAKNYNQDSISLSSIANNEAISPKYLERLFSQLKKAKLIISEKGSLGGYKLSKSPETITILDIVSVLEGDISLFHCLGDGQEIKCSQKCNCGATPVLVKVQNAVNSTLKSIKLSDLI
jgi:Rrf2 family transcriptional regulator, cysteine metabolism repressor